jgi:hypothetical protein
MAKKEDLMSLGFSWPIAALEGLSSVAITAAGTTSADATAANSLANNVFIMTASGSDGIRMSSSTPLLNPVFVCNTAAGNGKVYPHTGGAVNGGSTDAGETCNATTVQIWMRVSSTAWVAVLGA